MTISQVRDRIKPRILFLLGITAFIILIVIASGVGNAGANKLYQNDLDVVIIRKTPAEEDDGPDCGKNPYLWNPIGQHYQRKFATACFFVNWDENEKLYHDLWLDQTPLGP